MTRHCNRALSALHPSQTTILLSFWKLTWKVFCFLGKLKKQTCWTGMELTCAFPVQSGSDMKERVPSSLTKHRSPDMIRAPLQAPKSKRAGVHKVTAGRAKSRQKKWRCQVHCKAEISTANCNMTRIQTPAKAPADQPRVSPLQARSGNVSPPCYKLAF